MSAIAAVLVIAATLSVTQRADQPAPRTDQNSMTAHAQLLEKAKTGKIDVYFVGDSITRRWGALDYPELLENWKANFHGWNAANFGWGADRVENILWRMENGELDGVNPKIIVMLAGTNNLPARGGVDESDVTGISRGLEALLDVCRRKAPEATVVLTAIFPRNDNMAVMPAIVRINQNLARLADGKRVRYLDINGRLADGEGTLLEGVMNPDKLHPSLKAYQIWADALKPIFTEILGPPAGTDLAPPPTGDPSAANRQTTAAAPGVRIEKLASLEFPWGIALLPDGRLLITEKPGQLRIFSNGKLSPPVENVPTVAYREAQGEQGGLLDVAVDPDFAQNQRIFLSYSEQAPQASSQPADNDPRFAGFLDPKDNRLMGGAVASARLEGSRLSDVKVIWRQEPKMIARGHFGHRIIFGRDGTMFITSGDRMRFDPAQDLRSNLGKVVRINRDGSLPKDNPFAGKADARGDVWSLGHRNMLAAAVHPASGQLWVFEMGPLGGDELNVIEPGKNYGWPVVSNGDNYDKSPIPDHPTKPEFAAPVKTWTPVISPSGALFYDGALFPWRGNVLVGSLSARGIVRLTVEGTRVVDEQRIELQRRVRDILQAPDGALLVITDHKDGELLRLTP